MSESKVSIDLPEIGEGINEGEFTKWFVKVGDHISVDQTLCEVLTDKATVEVPSSLSGKVLSLNAQPGDIIPVGQALLEIQPTEASGQVEVSSAEPTGEKEKSTSPVENRVEAVVSSQEFPTQEHSAQDLPAVAASVLATPSTRRFARELGVDINKVPGSGLHGRVTREDVRSFQATSVTSSQASMSSGATFRLEGAAADVERVPLLGIRRKIAQRMLLSKQNIPHFSLIDEANLASLVKCREDLKERGVKITYLPFVMKALVCTVKEFPFFNAVMDEEKQELVVHRACHIGFAADTPEGLMVPVVHYADSKTTREIADEIQSKALLAREGKLAREDMMGATITVTNMGSIGGMAATPVINPPEVAIIGMYRLVKIPRFDNTGAVIEAPLMNLSCTADHRWIDGAQAARFLASLIHKLENPLDLMLGLK